MPRFPGIPTFGRWTIFRFQANVSDMKKLAARDFEDILQRQSNVFGHSTDSTSHLPPTITAFDVMDIPVPPADIVKELGRMILLDPGIRSIVLVHSPAHRGQNGRYPLWLATIWSSMEPAREAKTVWHTALASAHETLEKSTTRNAAAQGIRAALKVLEKLPCTAF
ncbi:hypothetical protein B0H13DRAFT_2355510 [Mycena leptocephala]|nr:hypothetical protein B0H13DRAFT_2355510 [Mycena leptocephala]